MLAEELEKTEQKIRRLEGQFAKGKEADWSNARLLSILREANSLRRKISLHKGWLNWADQTGPLFGVPEPTGKKESGRA